jgi:hypothetical protein
MGAVQHEQATMTRGRWVACLQGGNFAVGPSTVKYFAM